MTSLNAVHAKIIDDFLVTIHTLSTVEFKAKASAFGGIPTQVSTNSQQARPSLPNKLIN